METRKNCQLYSMNWKNSCWFLVFHLKRVIPDSKDKIVQFEALNLLLKTNGDKIKQCQTKRKVLVVLKQKQLHRMALLGYKFEFIKVRNRINNKIMEFGPVMGNEFLFFLYSILYFFQAWLLKLMCSYMIKEFFIFYFERCVF